MNQDAVQVVVVRPHPLFRLKTILLFLFLIFFSAGAVFLVSKFGLSPKAPTESLISCPVPKEYCHKGQNILYEGKVIGVGFNLPPGTPMFAVFDGQPESGAGMTAEGLNFKNIYLKSPDGYEADYSFQGERESLPFAAKKGDILGRVNGEEVSSTNKASLIFKVKRDGKGLDINKNTF